MNLDEQKQLLRELWALRYIKGMDYSCRSLYNDMLKYNPNIVNEETVDVIMALIGSILIEVRFYNYNIDMYDWFITLKK